MHQSEMLADYDEGKKLANRALSKIKRDDIIHRGFLKPIEIALKNPKRDTTSSQSQQNALDQQYFITDEQTQAYLHPNALPSGLQIAVKQSIHDNRFALQDVTALESNSSYESLKANSQDNILSLIKRLQGMELVVCVCMYSEDKKMLKDTLAGVAENIANLILRGGVEPDKVAVLVVMDGIEKVDPSVVGYFSELERSNCMNLGENLPPELTMEELIRRASTKSESEINEEELRNINNFLFDPAELQDRNERSFPSVKSQYEAIKDLLSTIQVLKKKKTLFDDLPAKVRPFFFEEARAVKKKVSNLSDRQLKWITEDRLIDQFALDIRKARPIIIKALQECERYCREYLESREDLAYLVAFRKRILLGLIDEEETIDEDSILKSMALSEGSERKIVEESEEESPSVAMNLFLCVKYRNSGKLSSHNWFFNGFCKELRPKYTVLLDVGLKPEGEALFKMYRYMRANEKVGGVCGYMSLKIEQLGDEEEAKLGEVDCFSRLCLKFADIQRTQQVEYHFAHLIDKAFESCFGFIHVLPGAFSAYNMRALLDYQSKEDDLLLRSYFKSIDEKLLNSKVLKSEVDLRAVLARLLLPDFLARCFLDIHPESEEQMLYNENIYLAEDRILCMGIHKKGFDIKFLPDAYAEVDPIKTVHGLLGQRKRWINGSFFAFEKVKKELGQHEERKGVELCLNVQILYLTLMNFLAYLAPSFILFTVHIAMDAFRVDILARVFSGLVGDPENSEVLKSFVYTIDFIYVMLVGSIVYYSLHLTSSSRHFKPYIYAISTIFGLFAISIFVVLAVDVFNGLIDNTTFLQENQALISAIPGGINTINSMRWILIISTLIFCVPVILYTAMYRKVQIGCEVVMGAFSFLFYGPTYLNILNIYSLCRIDDISWGTKGLEASATSKNVELRDKWYLFKMLHVGKFLICNIVLSVVLLIVGHSNSARFFITIILVSLIALALAFKVLLALLYLLAYRLIHCRQKEERGGLVGWRESRLERLFDLYGEDVLEEVREHLYSLAHNYNNNNYKEYPLSFIQLSRIPSHVGRSVLKQKEEFLARSRLSNRLSLFEGITEKKESGRSNNNYLIRALNEFNLPIETRNALDVLEDFEKKNSLFSIDKKPSQFSLDKKASQFSLDKRNSQFELEKRNSLEQIEKKNSLQLEKRNSLRSMEKRNSGNSMEKSKEHSSERKSGSPLEKRSSLQVMEKRASRGELDKKVSVREIHQEEEHLESQNARNSVEKPETIGEEEDESEQSINYLTPEVVRVRARKKKGAEVVTSRFRPSDEH